MEIILRSHFIILTSSSALKVYVFAEALAEGAVKMGMPSVLAQRFAAQTILVSIWVVSVVYFF